MVHLFGHVTLKAECRVTLWNAGWFLKLVRFAWPGCSVGWNPPVINPPPQPLVASNSSSVQPWDSESRAHGGSLEQAIVP